MFKRIAKIKRTFLGIEDHGIFTASLEMDYGGSGQSVGGFVLNCPTVNGGSWAWGVDYAAKFILLTLGAAGVDKWEQLPGRTLFVLFDNDDFHAVPRGFAPLPTEPGKEFVFSDYGFGVSKAQAKADFGVHPK